MQPPLAAPPRRIPLAVRLPLLFGGWAPIAGWMMILVAGFVGWSMAPKTDFTTPFLRTTDSASARVLDVQVYRHPNGEDGESTTWAVYYTFAVDEQTAFGRSYTTSAAPRIGETFAAEFPHGEPDRSCLHGMRRKPLPLFGIVLAFLIALVGVTLAVFGSRRGRRALALLRDGEVTRATLVDKQPTNFYINEQQVFRMRFQFEAADGRSWDVVAKTHRPQILEDDATEQVLYLPSDPRWATLLDHLPGAPRVLPDGTIAPGKPVLAIGVALVVATAVAAHLGGLWYILSR
jgi:hypothetical protein